jgi:DNA-binding transcriptional LysR family regulator
MEIRDIRYFKEVAARLNLGRAALALDMSTTALSKSLRRLEKSVGGKLVKRTPKGVELTAIGAALYAQAGRLQLVLDDIRHQTSDLASGRAGHVRAGATPGLAEYCLSAAFEALLREAPAVSLRANVVASYQIDALLRSGDVDIIVNSVRPSIAPDVVCEPLFRDNRVVYAAANHRLAKRKRITFADLAEEQWSSDIEAASWKALCRQFEDQGLRIPKVVLESNSLELRLPVIAASDLLIHSSSIVVQRAKLRYKLVELQVVGYSVAREIGVFYRKDGYLSPATRRMIEILKEQGRVARGKQTGKK